MVTAYSISSTTTATASTIILLTRTQALIREQPVLLVQRAGVGMSFVRALDLSPAYVADRAELAMLLGADVDLVCAEASALTPAAMQWLQSMCSVQELSTAVKTRHLPSASCSGSKGLLPQLDAQQQHRWELCCEGHSSVA